MNTAAFVVGVVIFLIILAIGIVLIVTHNKFTNSNGVLIAGIVLTVLAVLMLFFIVLWYWRSAAPTQVHKVEVIRTVQPLTVSPQVQTELVALAPVEPPLIPEKIQPITM